MAVAVLRFLFIHSHLLRALGLVLGSHVVQICRAMGPIYRKGTARPSPNSRGRSAAWNLPGAGFPSWTRHRTRVTDGGTDWRWGQTCFSPLGIKNIDASKVAYLFGAYDCIRPCIL